MTETIGVAGAAAIGDHIFHVDHLPEKGEIVTVTSFDGALVPGGCAPNIAVGIAALGRAGAKLYYPVGEDFDASGLLERWSACGVDCAGLTRVHGVPSGRAWMYMQEDGTTMCFALPGAAAVARPDGDAVLPDWVVVAPVLNEYTKTILDSAVRQRRRVVVTGIGSGALEPWLEALTALVVNRREAETLCRDLGAAGCAALSRRCPGLLVYVTDGGRGSALYENGGETRVPPVRCDRLTDFTGAGDAFTAGVVSALASGMAPDRAAWYGAAAASFVIERLGGQCGMPDWAALERRLRDQFPGGLNEKDGK